MSDLKCMCGNSSVSIRSERDVDGFGEFIWAECSGCGLRARSKFVSERCPQSNQECFDDFKEIIKPFNQQHDELERLRGVELEYFQHGFLEAVRRYQKKYQPTHIAKLAEHIFNSEYKPKERDNE